MNQPPLSLSFFISVTSSQHTSVTLSLFSFFSLTSSQHTSLTPNLSSNFLVSSSTHIGRQTYLLSTATQSLKMCIHEFYLSKTCGHHFPKVRQPAGTAFFNDHCPTISVPHSLTCVPVKLALKFYHDQVVYLPADMNCGSKVEIPRSCPIVHSPPDGTTEEERHEVSQGQLRADATLRNNMLLNGLGPRQEWQIERDAGVPDRCSNRAKPGDHNPVLLRRHKRQEYPLNMHAHVLDVKAYQSRSRSHMIPNVRYIEVDFGCGGPFSAECLNGWDVIRLLTHRSHLWGDGTTHPRPCNDECLAGWSGDGLDAYRRETWRCDDALGWRDITDYSTSAHKSLVKKTEDSEQWWTALDFSNISHRHPVQWKSLVWDGSELMSVPQLLTEQELPIVKVPECVWVPVPDRLHKILLDKSKTKPAETPEMRDKRVKKAWNVIRWRIWSDHTANKKKAVVEEGQITFHFCPQARRQVLITLTDSDQAKV